jgi:hypothetical protein
MAESPSSTQLVLYDTMCAAITEAAAVDEVKEIRDKAAALALYARQARNVEAERQCVEIRIRAERRAGELLRQMEKAKGSPGNQYTGPLDRREGSKTLSDFGISYDQSARWQQLASVPQDVFEAAFRAEDMPSTSGILRAADRVNLHFEISNRREEPRTVQLKVTADHSPTRVVALRSADFELITLKALARDLSAILTRYDNNVKLTDVLRCLREHASPK